MKLKNLFETEKMVLEVTIPQSMEFVEAALAGGTQALKMRCNQSGMSGFSNVRTTDLIREGQIYRQNIF